MFLFQRIGFSVLLAMIFLAALMSLFDRRCYYSKRQVYDSVILEEGEDVLKDTLRKAAKDELLKMISEKINGNDNRNGGGNENKGGNGNGGGNGNRHRNGGENGNGGQEGNQGGGQENGNGVGNVGGNENGGGNGNGGGKGKEGGNEHKWIECFDVAAQMIKNSSIPKLSKEQRKEEIVVRIHSEL